MNTLLLIAFTFIVGFILGRLNFKPKFSLEKVEQGDMFIDRARELTGGRSDRKALNWLLRNQSQYSELLAKAMTENTTIIFPDDYTYDHGDYSIAAIRCSEQGLREEDVNWKARRGNGNESYYEYYFRGKNALVFVWN